jgi:hypothetical protein
LAATIFSGAVRVDEHVLSVMQQFADVDELQLLVAAVDEALVRHG